MPRISFLLCAFFFLCAPALAPALAQDKLGIAAIVNSDIITTRDVDGRIYMALQGAPIKPDEKIMREFRHQALEALIDEQIRIQEAQRLGAKPPQKEVDDAFNKLAAQNNLNPEQFKEVLAKKPGMYDSLQHQLTAQISWANVVKQKVRPKINITESDITSYIAEKEKNPAKIEFQVAEIFLKQTDVNRKLADQIIAELKAGKRFSVLARQFSQGLEASKGGLLGWLPEKTLEPIIDDTIKTTPVGELTPPITSERGIHIFLVLGKRDILQTAEASQRLNLKQIVLPLPPQLPPDIEAKALEKARIWQREAKDCATMDDIIKKINSPLSRDLGKIRLADLPASAIPVVKTLPEGKASDPLRANDGYLIFMVCGRDENSPDLMRDDIANLIGTERLNRLQSRYYRDLRAAAYVDIK